MEIHKYLAQDSEKQRESGAGVAEAAGWLLLHANKVSQQSSDNVYEGSSAWCLTPTSPSPPLPNFTVMMFLVANIKPELYTKGEARLIQYKTPIPLHAYKFHDGGEHTLCPAPSTVFNS